MRIWRYKGLLIALTIIVVIIIIASIALYPFLTMNPVDTGAIKDTDVIAIKNKKNNLYLIESADGYIVIDAGSDVSEVKRSLEQLSIAITDIRYVLLTHTDYDHVAALNLFSHAKIFMDADELKMIDSSTKRSIFGRNELPVDAEDLTLINDGQELNLGGRKIEWIKTSGHTPGSASFLIDEQYLFTGDAIKVSGNVMGIHPFTMDKEASRKTIRQLQDILPRTRFLFTAHYGYHEAKGIKIEIM